MFLLIPLYFFSFSLYAVVKRSCHSELLKCEHLCREPANEKAECGCKDGYVLQSDGTSCAGKT